MKGDLRVRRKGEREGGRWQECKCFFNVLMRNLMEMRNFAKILQIWRKFAKTSFGENFRKNHLSVTIFAKIFAKKIIRRLYFRDYPVDVGILAFVSYLIWSGTNLAHIKHIHTDPNKKKQRKKIYFTNSAAYKLSLSLGVHLQWITTYCTWIYPCIPIYKFFIFHSILKMSIKAKWGAVQLGVVWRS